MSKRSQSATEFIVLASFMLLVLFGFFAVVSSKILNTKDDDNKKIAEDLAQAALKEIETAKSVSDGYARTFVMPQTVNGIDYTINITDNRELLVSYLGNEYVSFLPSNVSGNISKGQVQIFKQNGIVYLKSAPPVCGNGVCEQQESCSTCQNDCGSCPPTRYFLVKNALSNILSFNIDGSATLKGSLQQNSNPQQSSDDEFVLNDKNGRNVAMVDLVTGNMFIRGSLQENQLSLSPPSGGNLVVKDSAGNVLSYFDESGNFVLKSFLIQNGNP